MDIDEVADLASFNLLPRKSAKRYNFAYDFFKKWCSLKKVNIVTENVMLAYMVHRSEKLKSPSSLWCEYSMLKTTITLRENVDISKFYKLIAFLKKKNEGYTPKKSKILDQKQVMDFLKNAPDETYLLSKVNNTNIFIL